MTLLFRLLKDGVVVGYEKHEDGKIYHSRMTYDSNGEKDTISQYHDILELKYNSQDEWHTPFYIKYDRKDLYAGVEVDGVKVFHRDKIDVESWENGQGYIDFRDGAFVVVFDEAECYLTDHGNLFKITGIIGVTP